MNKETIDKVVWWIPIRSIRDLIRQYFDDIRYIRDDINYMKNNIVSTQSNVIEKAVEEIERHMKVLFLLEDDFSKKTLMSIAMTKGYDVRFLKPILPTIEEENNAYQSFVKNSDINNKIRHYTIDLLLHDLQPLGKDVKIYTESAWLIANLFYKQYEYHSEYVVIKPEEGDFIIDGGACVGDTSLILANDVGESGRIFSFEFVPHNIENFQKNIDMNPNLKNRVHITEKALSEYSNETLYFSDGGSGTSVTDIYDVDSLKVKTITIDDFVKQNNIKKIDMIKLDIEGSELSCLKGSLNTIKQFKPKLAICVYHKPEDIYDIPAYIKSIMPKYKIFLKQNCRHCLHETVLYAIV